MKNYFALIFSILLGTGLVHAQGDTIRVLAIGNSFSEDAVEHYLYDLGKERGITFIIGNLYIPGCSLQTHWECAKGDKPDYEYRKIAADGTYTNTPKSMLLDGILDEPWDYISVQQNSGNSGFVDTYFPYLDSLLNYVNMMVDNPYVKYAFHETWAYQNGSTHPDFPRYGNDQLTMYNDIVKATQEAVKKATIRRIHSSFPTKDGIEMVIPSGTAIQNGRTSKIGDNYNRDGYHLNLLYGRYTAACAWFETLTGLSILDSHYAPVGVSEEYADIARRAAHAAVKYPYEITQITN